jgi:hypothetical protein
MVPPGSLNGGIADQFLLRCRKIPDRTFPLAMNRRFRRLHNRGRLPGVTHIWPILRPSNNGFLRSRRMDIGSGFIVSTVFPLPPSGLS